MAGIMKLIPFLLGCAVGWWLVRRRSAADPRAPWVVLDSDGNATLTNAAPMARYAAMADDWMPMGWMQADGTWTWSGTCGYDGRLR